LYQQSSVQTKLWTWTVSSFSFSWPKTCGTTFYRSRRQPWSKSTHIVPPTRLVHDGDAGCMAEDPHQPFNSSRSTDTNAATLAC